MKNQILISKLDIWIVDFQNISFSISLSLIIFEVILELDIVLEYIYFCQIKKVVVVVTILYNNGKLADYIWYKDEVNFRAQTNVQENES